MMATLKKSVEVEGQKLEKGAFGKVLGHCWNEAHEDSVYVEFPAGKFPVDKALVDLK
jgi:hypothetical protein